MCCWLYVRASVQSVSGCTTSDIDTSIHQLGSMECSQIFENELVTPPFRKRQQKKIAYDIKGIMHAGEVDVPVQHAWTTRQSSF